LEVQVQAQAEPEPLMEVRVWPEPEPEPRTSGSVWVRTRFERFANWTVASLLRPKRQPSCRLGPFSHRRLDCPRVGPGPCGPGSGPDRRGRSEGPGQIVAEWTGPGGVQGQKLDGPDLGVRPSPDPDRAYCFSFFFGSFFQSLFTHFPPFSTPSGHFPTVFCIFSHVFACL
jgi:hypothetical protein